MSASESPGPQYVTLREYVDARLDAMEVAVDKAEDSADRRFNAVNEMRAMVTDAATKFMARTEFETAHRAVLEKIEALQKFVWLGLGAVLTIEIVFSFIKK